MDDLGVLREQLEGFFARRATRGADAEDLAQETLVKALAQWGQLRRPAARRAWVFTIAHNLLRDQHRASAREPLLQDGVEDRADAGISPQWRNAVREAVAQALAEVPATHRHVVLLRLFDDLSFAEIGRRLGIPEPTARTRAFHALRRVRAAVATRLHEGGWLVDCETVRERLLRMAFGLAPKRTEEEVLRHLAACATCRREVELIDQIFEGWAATVHSAVVVGGWALHDLSGNVTSYWLSEDINREREPQDAFETLTSEPGGWAVFDASGTPLEELGRSQSPDGRHWTLRFRLTDVWMPGQPLRLVFAAPMRWNVRRSGGTWTAAWSEHVLSAGAEGIDEVLCRRVLQLPPGCEVTECEPEPDHRLADGTLLLWSMVLGKGEEMRLRIQGTSGQ